MKKTYVKPALFVESFAMTQSIAAGCGWISVTLRDPNSCTTEGDIPVFNDSNTNCYLKDSEVEEYCYNHPEGAISVFYS